MKLTRQICIVGAGGLARETLVCLKDCLKNTNYDIEDWVCFMVKDKDFVNQTLFGIKVIPESQFDVEKYDVVVAVGDVFLRRKIVRKLPKETRYTTIIHPSAIISDTVFIGDGTIIMAGTIVTCNVFIGMHSVIDRQAMIGHDCKSEAFFHLAPNAVLSGNVMIGSLVFIGAGALLKENISIVDNVLIGMGSIVLRTINETGVYAGNPSRYIKRRNE